MPSEAADQYLLGMPSEYRLEAIVQRLRGELASADWSEAADRPYRPVSAAELANQQVMVGHPGFEPGTSPLSEARSNRLS